MALGGLGDVARLDGDFARARALLTDSRVVYSQQWNKSSITFVLEALATVAVAPDSFERAAVSWGAADAPHRAIGTCVLPACPAEYALHQARVHEELGKTPFTEYALAD